MAATEAGLSTVERVAEVLRRLGLRRAHVLAASGQAVDLAAAHPELVASLTMVCPMRFMPEALRPIESRVLFVRGDRGPNAPNVPRAVEALPGATVVTLPDYEDAAWSDVIAERTEEVRQAVLGFLDEVTRREGVESARLDEGTGEAVGVRYRVRGSGPPVVLMPLNLAPSQWDALIPALAERYCTIALGGQYMGMVATLETRIRGGYGDVVRQLVETAGIQPGQSVLEVGCGSGAVVRWLAKHTGGANPITAVDINRYLLGEARVLAERDGVAERIDFREGSAVALPLPDGAFDVTLSSTVMEEVDADVMLAELLRVTKPGGRVGVVVRSEDVRLWVDLPLRPELRTRIEAAPGPGKSEQGCADSGLYHRFRAAGVTDLKMGPLLATNYGDLGAEWLTRIESRLLYGLSPEETQEVRSAFARAAAEGTLMWAEPYHMAVGTKR